MWSFQVDPGVIMGKLILPSSTFRKGQEFPQQAPQDVKGTATYLISVDHVRLRNFHMPWGGFRCSLSFPWHARAWRNIAQLIKVTALSHCGSSWAAWSGYTKETHVRDPWHVGEASCLTRQTCFPTCCCFCYVIGSQTYVSFTFPDKVASLFPQCGTFE